MRLSRYRYGHPRFVRLTDCGVPGIADLKYVIVCVAAGEPNHVAEEIIRRRTDHAVWSCAHCATHHIVMIGAGQGRPRQVRTRRRAASRCATAGKIRDASRTE